MSATPSTRAILSTPAVYIKAILATVIAGLGALGTALTDGELTGAELVGVLSATVVAASLVFSVPNQPLAEVKP